MASPQLAAPRSIGYLEPFDESASDWLTYEKRLTAYLRVNKIDDADSVYAFISLVGPKTYSLLVDLLAPVEPDTKKLEDLTKVLRDHLSPQPSVIAERAKFHKRMQKETESIADFVADLKHLTQYCKFGATLDEVLRDRFVCGLYRLDIQKSLFSEDEKLTFKRAVEKALSLEQAAKNATECRDSASVEKAEFHKFRAHKVSGQQSTANARLSSSACDRCGSNGHSAENCLYKNATCHKCGRSLASCMQEYDQEKKAPLTT